MLCSAGLSDTSLFKVKSAVLSAFSSSVNAKELCYPLENTQSESKFSRETFATDIDIN